MASFNKGIQGFGDSMDKATKEFSEDIRKSDIQKEKRAIKDKENLKKIFGDKK